MQHTLTSCFWKDTESKMFAHTHWCVHTHSWTHTHTLTRHMGACVHAHRYTHLWCIRRHAWKHTHTLLAHTDTHCDVHTHTHTHTRILGVHTHTHTYTHTHRSCKSDKFENSLVFSHITSILVSIEQRRESRVWPTIRWHNSVAVGKMYIFSPVISRNHLITHKFFFAQSVVLFLYLNGILLWDYGSHKSSVAQFCWCMLCS